MNDETIIVRRLTTEEEDYIGVRMARIGSQYVTLLRDLVDNGYCNRDPKRFDALHELLKTFCKTEANLLGFNSMDDLRKWQDTHGSIFQKIET